MDDPAWACHACTYLNSGSRLSCSICSTVRSPLHDDVPLPLITTPLARSSSSSSSSNGFRRPRLVDEAPFFFSMCGVQRLVAGALSGALAGMFAVVGAFTGAVTGAVAGRATDSGLLRGAGVGAIAGAVISVGVLEASWAYWHSQPPNSGSLSSLVEFLEDFLNGRYAQDQVAPSTVAAHHWQVNISELNYDELYELFGPGEVGVKGLSDELLAKLPWQKVIEKTELDSSGEVTFCSICLQELLQGEIARSLPPCNHMFHMSCVDKWLMMHGSCPVCRQEISKVWK